MRLRVNSRTSSRRDASVAHTSLTFSFSAAPELNLDVFNKSCSNDYSITFDARREIVPEYLVHVRNLIRFVPIINATLKIGITSAKCRIVGIKLIPSDELT